MTLPGPRASGGAGLSYALKAGPSSRPTPSSCFRPAAPSSTPAARTPAAVSGSELARSPQLLKETLKTFSLLFLRRSTTCRGIAGHRPLVSPPPWRRKAPGLRWRSRRLAASSPAGGPGPRSPLSPIPVAPSLGPHARPATSTGTGASHAGLSAHRSLSPRRMRYYLLGTTLPAQRSLQVTWDALFQSGRDGNSESSDPCQRKPELKHKSPADAPLSLEGPRKKRRMGNGRGPHRLALTPRPQSLTSTLSNFNQKDYSSSLETRLISLCR